MNNLKDNNTEMQNFIAPVKKEKRKLKIFFKFHIYFIFFILLIFSIFSYGVISSNESSWFSNFSVLKHLTKSAEKKLKGEDGDRINILLLGMGGKKHQGSYLTDTIILNSLKPSSKEVFLLSVPRDLHIPMENKGWRKINNINAFAEVNRPDSGGLATSQALSDVLDIPIDYYIRIDFEGFINIIDLLGGVKIDVENTFDDYSYPVRGAEKNENWNSRFEHLHIDKGVQFMNGSFALKYARSRHAAWPEGSDFARAKRQQKIIQATKERLLLKKNLLNPKVIAGVISEFNEHIDTNLKIWEIMKLWDLFKDVSKENIINKVLDDAPDNLLTATRTPEGAYALMPKSGDFTEIQYLVENVFFSAPPGYKEKIIKEGASLEIKNGTWLNGLASRVSIDMKRLGFEITQVGNCSKQNFVNSVIYDLTYGIKKESLNILQERTRASVFIDLPDWLMADIEKDIKNNKNTSKPDFILILGRSADSTASGVINKE